ncbi:flagellar protein FliS [Planctomicrobium piriforme]|nr:flagellar protein FliS [Planctomicrobium piriforme]
MHPHLAYRRSAQSAWTRIDMLLAIYNAAIESMDSGIDLLNRHDSQAYPSAQLRTSQLLLLLLDGIDPDSAEVSARIRDLCIFCFSQISTPSIENWTNAREVLATLRDGFEAIRAEGVRLEAEGVIPQLSMSASHTVLHA